MNHDCLALVTGIHLSWRLDRPLSKQAQSALCLSAYARLTFLKRHVARILHIFWTFHCWHLVFQAAQVAAAMQALMRADARYTVAYTE